MRLTKNVPSPFSGFVKTFAPYIPIFLLLFCLFDFNAFNTAPRNWFAGFQIDSNGAVYGRLAASRYEGFFSHGGMLGHYSEKGQEIAPQILLQYRAYFAGIMGPEWVIYEPQIGLQGMVFGLIDRFLVLDDWNFSFFEGLTSLFNAAIITGIIAWIGVEIGIFGVLGIVFGLFYSPWLVVMGRNLYWVFGTCFLPMLIMAWGFHRLRYERKPDPTKIMLALFAAIFVRAACGYEYLTTIVMAAWVPVVFYACLDRWKMRRFINVTLLLGCVSIAAFLLAFVINIGMLAAAQHTDLTIAFRSVFAHAEVRLGGPILDSKNFIDPALLENPQSLHASIWSVVDAYLKGFMNGGGQSDGGIAWPPTFDDVVIGACFLSLFVLLREWPAFPVLPQRRALIALIAAMWAAFWATLSWHIIAHQHSYVHRHISYVLWYLPFMFLFYALLAEVTVGALYRKFFPGTFSVSRIKTIFCRK